MDINLTNKTALVCGSTDGIGKAIAIELATLGCNIILCARNEEKLEHVKNQLNASENQKHEYFVADFSNLYEFSAKASASLKDKTIHILINNTGGPPAGLAIDARVEEYLQAFQNHLICNHTLTQLVVDGMKKEKFGRIINIISTSVKAPLKGLGVSNNIRGAVANWSKTLANELAIYGITVNNVLPGATKTDRLKNIIKNKSQKTNIASEEVEMEMLEEIPCKRFAEPKEIAMAVAFLASPSASYVNGINLPVDGGRTVCL